MSKSNAFETDLLKFIFQDVAIPWEATSTDLNCGLHTASPGEAGTQATNETGYTSYARVATTRGTGDWSISGDTISNVDAITFPKCTGGTSTITHVGIGTDATGAGNLVYHGALTSSLAVSTNITPEFAAGDLDVTED